MAYSLSFNDSFFTGPYDGEAVCNSSRPGLVCVIRDSDHAHVWVPPFTVYQALLAMSAKAWRAMLEDMNLGRYTDASEVLDLVRETDTCSGLKTPVEVWIDPDGYHTVEVYDSPSWARD